MIKEKKKIALIVDCLSKGGAEKVAALLSQSFFNQGYEVFIISLRDDVSYSYKGKLYNLGKNDSRIKVIKQLNKLFLFNKYYKKINADVYIDFRMRNRFLMELLLHLFVFKMKKMIMTIHNYNVFFHIPKQTFFFRQYNKAKAVVSVSKEISLKMKSVYNFKNLYYVPNFFSNKKMLQSNEEFESPNHLFILSIGRLQNEIKQFDKLILTYMNSKPFKEGIPLFILGEGRDRPQLESLIKAHGLKEEIKLLGFKENPYAYMKASKFLVVSSKVEGFPMVILETLAIGTPVVSFDCKSGPSEMIINRQNGLLVEDQNFKALQFAVDELYANENLYEKCKVNAASSVTNFSKENVFKNYWVKLVES